MFLFAGASSKYTDVKVVIGVHPDGTPLPAFVNLPSISTKVLEGAASGDVMTVKAEAQGGSVQYSIVGGNLGGAFDIDSAGKIVIKSLLDYEAVSEYNLVLRATKTGASPALVQEATVTIPIGDVNDNKPVFNVRGNSVEVTVQTNAESGLLASMVSLLLVFFLVCTLQS